MREATKVVARQFSIEQAGAWLLRSGIVDGNGGVARYYRSDLGTLAPISTEITGYTISALVWLYDHTKNSEYLQAAGKSARFLLDRAWLGEPKVMPFELQPDHDGGAYTYFFDCGIVVRGLLAYWRHARDQRVLDGAVAIGRSMQRLFERDGRVEPVVHIFSGEPEPQTAQWSRSSGCYQLKAGLAWHQLHQITGESHFGESFEALLEYSLGNDESFLPGNVEEPKVMDRLHAYSYFLEGLLPCLNRRRVLEALREGLARAGYYLQAISPRIQRSDVCAQLLRAQLYAEALAALPLDDRQAARQASDLAAYQVRDERPAYLGGFWFGRKNLDEMLPYINPVSTAFGLQALELFQMRMNGPIRVAVEDLI